MILESWANVAQSGAEPVHSTLKIAERGGLERMFREAMAGGNLKRGLGERDGD
jgi:hypothetical protein